MGRVALHAAAPVYGDNAAAGIFADSALDQGDRDRIIPGYDYMIGYIFRELPGCPGSALGFQPRCVKKLDKGKRQHDEKSGMGNIS